MVPDRAYDIWQSKPDFRGDDDWELWDASDYDNRSGDLMELVNEASANGALVDVGDGTYEVESAADMSGTIGIVGDGARIHYVGRGDGISKGVLFSGQPGTFVLEGVTFDITEDPSTGSTDIGLVYTTGCDELWIKDITLEGSRHRMQDLGSGYEAQGGWTTFLVQMSDDSEALVENVTMPDGGTDVRDEPGVDHTDHAYSLHADPSHEGYNVFKDCHIANWAGNGYYTQSAPGTTVLWNCDAVNCARGNFRPGQHDRIIGGRAEVNTDYDHEYQPGTPFVGDVVWDCEVYGLEVVAEGDDWGNNVLELRNETQDILFEECSFHIKSGDNAPLRIDAPNEVPRITFEDCFVLDEGSASNTFYIGTWGNGGNNGELHLEGENYVEGGGDEFDIGSGNTLHHDGEEYENTTQNVSDLGLNPLTEEDLPEFYFDYENGDGGNGGDNGDTGDESIDSGTDDNADSTANEAPSKWSVILDALRKYVSKLGHKIASLPATLQGKLNTESD